jgi:zinc protease
MTGRLLVLGLCAAALASAQAPAASSAIPSYKDLRFPPLPQVKVPEPATFTLSNGMRIFLLEDHELPVISGFALVRTGNLFDPNDKRGVSSIMAEVMRSGGTREKTGDQLDEELENIAGSVESGMGETDATVSFSGLKETSDNVLRVFKQVLTEPEFRQDKIDLSITQAKSGIARRNDEAQGIAERELTNLLYGRETPYGWTIEYEHLNGIKREDLQAFYRRYYFPKNIILAVYGDFSTTAMRDTLEKLFADWKVEQPAVPAFPQVTAKPAPGVYLAEKTDVTQTFFSMGLLAGKLSDPDYPALQVAANILGSGFNSRLMSQIRTKMGLAYSIGAGWGAAYDHPGTFRITGSTKSMSTTEALEAAKVELEKMRTTEVTDQELKTAKDGVLNSFVFFFDSPAKTLNRVMMYEYFGYPKTFLFDYQKRIEAVTRADVLRVVKDHINPANLTIVAAGNPKDFGKPLSALGKVEQIDLTIPEPKASADASKSSGEGTGPVTAQAAALTGLNPPGLNAASTAGRAMLAGVQQAVGGAEKLAAIRDLSFSAQMQLQSPTGALTVKEKSVYLAKGVMRQEQDLPFGKMTAYSDGQTGWLATANGVQPMPQQVVDQARGEMSRQWPWFLLRTSEAIATGDHELTIGGVRVEIDPGTGLPAREIYATAGAEIAQTFSDWREVGGVKLPYQMVITQSGRVVAQRQVQEYKTNSVTDERVLSGVSAQAMAAQPMTVQPMGAPAGNMQPGGGSPAVR